MNVQGVSSIKLFLAIFARVYKAVREMSGLNVVHNIGRRLMLETITDHTKMTSISIFGNKIFKFIVALKLWKSYKEK